MLTTREGFFVVANPGMDIALEIVRPRTSLTWRVGHGHVGRGGGEEREESGRGDEHTGGKSCGLHWIRGKRVKRVVG